MSIMNFVQRKKEKASLRLELTILLTKCKDDDEFMKRLYWARDIIDEMISDFLEDEE